MPHANPSPKVDPLAEAKPTSRAGAIFLGAFGSVFALAGLATLVFALPDALQKSDHESILAASIVGGLFTFVGLGIVWLALRGQKSLSREAELARRHPDSPWLWKEEWANRQIEGTAQAAMVAVWIFTVIWNAISWPILPKIVETIRGGETAAAFGLLFPVVGLGLLALAIRNTLAYRRFGKSVFHLDSLPGVIGGELAGTVRIEKALPLPSISSSDGTDGMQVRLLCVRRVKTGSGDNSSTHETILYESKRTVPLASIHRSPLGSELPLRFTIPFDNLGSDDSNPRNRLIWRLELECAFEGADYETQFEVPVFKTSESSPDVVEEKPTEAELDEAVRGGGVLAGSKVVVSALPGDGVELYFGRARNKGMATTLTAFSVVWGAGVFFLFTSTDIPFVFRGFAALMELFVLYGAASLWLGTMRTRADASGLFVTSSLFGGGSEKHLSAADVERIEAEVGMRSGKQSFYRLRAYTGSGRAITCGTGLPDRAEAMALIALLERGLSRSARAA